MTAGFGVAAPQDPGGFVLAAVLSVAALFALGLFIGAVARSGSAAGAIGSLVFFPLMFFAGLWVPREVMPEVLRQIGDFTPLGAAVAALQEAFQGTFPSAASLLVLVAYAALFSLLAVRAFRWE